VQHDDGEGVPMDDLRLVGQIMWSDEGDEAFISWSPEFSLAKAEVTLERYAALSKMLVDVLWEIDMAMELLDGVLNPTLQGSDEVH
jgi:hypothetical protein